MYTESPGFVALLDWTPPRRRNPKRLCAFGATPSEAARAVLAKAAETPGRVGDTIVCRQASVVTKAGDPDWPGLIIQRAGDTGLELSVEAVRAEGAQ